MTAALRRDTSAGEGEASPFYFNAAHWRAIDGVSEGVRERAGIMLMTGPTGSGKTTLMRAISDDLDESVTPLFLQYASLNFKEFVNFLHSSLKVDQVVPAAANKAVALREFLYAQAKRDEAAVIFIDEAQNLEPDVLKMLPKLARFDELPDGRTVGLQFVLVGGADLREFLDDSDFDAVRASIDRSYELRFFTRGELKQFLDKRLAPIARMSGEPITPDAIDAVARYTGGSPRLIGMICSHAMLFAAENPGKVIDEAMIVEAAEALMMKPAENAFAHDDDAPTGEEGPYSRSDMDGVARTPPPQKGLPQENAEDSVYAPETEIEDFDFDPGFEPEEDAFDDDDDDDIDGDDLDHDDDYDDDDYEDDDYEDDDGERKSLFAGLKQRFARKKAEAAAETKVQGGARKRKGAEPRRGRERKIRTRTVGQGKRQAKIAVVALGAALLVGGAYAVRQPVAEAALAIKDGATALFSSASGAANGAVEAARGVIDARTAPPPEQTPDQAATRPEPSGGGWGARVIVSEEDSIIGTLRDFSMETPEPVVGIAKGALDAVSDTFAKSAQKYDGAFGGALDAAAGGLAKLSSNINGAELDPVEARARAAVLVTEGEAHLAGQRLIGPRSGNAYSSFREALAIDPDNEAAARHVVALREIFTQKAQNAREAQKWDQANLYFETAIAISKLRPVR